MDNTLQEGTSSGFLAFLAALEEIRAYVFIRGTIRNAWRRCGLNPLNPNVVLGPMKAKIAETAAIAAARPATPVRDPTDCLRRTPRGPESYRRNIFALKEHFVEHRNFNVEPRQMDRFIKGTEAMVNTLQLTTRDLEAAQKDTAQTTGRDAIPKYRAKTSGIISVAECREQYSERVEKEAAKAEAKAIREAAQAEEEAAKAEAKAKREAAQAEKKKTQAAKQAAKAAEKASKADAKARANAPAKKVQRKKKADDENAEAEKDEAAGPSTPPRPFTPPLHDIIPSVAVVEGRRVRKPSRKALEKDSASTPTPSSPPRRRRR